MRANPKKYKYWVKFKHSANEKKNQQDISWERLIEVVGEKKPHQIESVNFYHPDAPMGTAHVDGGTILALWQQVAQKVAGKK